MTWLLARDVSKDALERLLATEPDMFDRLVASDRVSDATAFAQIRITGPRDGELEAMAINAIRADLDPR